MLIISQSLFLKSKVIKMLKCVKNELCPLYRQGDAGGKSKVLVHEEGIIRRGGWG